MRQASRKHAASWETTDEAATPTTPVTGSPNQPYSEGAFPTTLMRFAAMEMYMASFVYPYARRMVPWSMLNAMNSEPMPP